MEITKNTPLSEILFNQDVADELSEIEGSLLRTVNERMDVVQAQISAGGLGQGMLVNGEPLFYNEARQICSDYLILSSNISMLVSDIKNAACEKELEELRKLRNLLLRDNDSWQALKEQYEREFRNLISNDKGDLINEPGPNYEKYREEYYGENGKITRVNKHIEENNEKIAEIDRRISTVSSGGSSGSSSGSGSGSGGSGGSTGSNSGSHTSSGGGTHSGSGRSFDSPSSNSGGSHTSSGGGTHSGGGSEIPDSSDSPSSNSGGSHTSSGGGTHSGGGSEIPEYSGSSTHSTGGETFGGSSGSYSSSGGSYSGGESKIPNEAPVEAPGEDYIYGEHGRPSSSSSTHSTGGETFGGSSGSYSSSGGTFSGGGSKIPNGDSSDDNNKSSNRSNQDGRFDDPDPNKYKL